jgi:hypothetical protein
VDQSSSSLLLRVVTRPADDPSNPCNGCFPKKGELLALEEVEVGDIITGWLWDLDSRVPPTEADTDTEVVPFFAATEEEEAAALDFAFDSEEDSSENGANIAPPAAAPAAPPPPAAAPPPPLLGFRELGEVGGLDRTDLLPSRREDTPTAVAAAVAIGAATIDLGRASSEVRMAGGLLSAWLGGENVTVAGVGASVSSG